jgi:hypothetical protein
MFYEGSKRLISSDVSIAPSRFTDSPRVVVEAYPRLVADKFSPGCSYKDRKGSDECRQSILGWLSGENTYCVRLEAKTGDEKACVDDKSGDTLDSVLCAVQAAWSWRVEAEEARRGLSRRTQRYGVPTLSIPCLKTQIDLEGWIVDPLLLDSIDSSTRRSK